MLELSPYRPRHFVFDGIWTSDGTEFKSHLVTTDDTKSISIEMIKNAKAYVDLAFPAIRQQEGNEHGLGYVILHAGEMGNWLLIHWWAYEDIALRMLASADIGQSQFKSEDHRRFHACVWEHVVIDHERDAWVRHAMNEPSDRAAYLKDTLKNGTH